MASVTRALRAIRQYPTADIDDCILNAINATLTLASQGRASDGWNRDLARNGRDYGAAFRAFQASQQR